MFKISSVTKSEIQAVIDERDDKLRQAIVEKFQEYSLGDLKNQKKKVVERLVEIEAVIQIAVALRAEAIRNTKLSAKALSEILDVSRATLYNDDVTIAYIDNRLEEYESNTEKKIRQELDDLRELYDNIKIDLINSGNREIRIKNLEDELNRRNIESVALADQRRELLEKVRMLERQLLKAGEPKIKSIEEKRVDKSKNASGKPPS